MVGVLGGAERGAGLWFTIKKFLTIGSITIFLVILLANAIIVSLQAHSLEPGLRDIGHRFLASTQDLDTETLRIIEQKGAFTRGDSWPATVWSFFINYSKLLAAIFVIWIWIS